MTDFVLDTSALLTLRDDEPGADRVADILAGAVAGRHRCYGSFMTRMEVLYRVWKDEGEAEGRLAYEQCGSLPIVWLGQDEAMLFEAAAIKARHALSIADAWIAAAAHLHDAILVHKDPEFAPLSLRQEMLPLKPAAKA